ncbi:MAG: class SAM-dependent methyltransferase [Candidatus Saccharibacteria bacterium]|nr:class SAM-dependent methyltransferase [Candidatus Saccharibacteria bacterium]
MAKTPSPTHKKADQYNDPKHNYLHYWDGRDYENAAEQIAIERLLKGQHFQHAVDVGGGYGRLCLLLEHYANKVTLAEPSQQQLDIAKDFLENHPGIERQLMQADNLAFKDGTVDLLTMIRVMHHLPDPSAEFAEIARVLSANGVFILEIANYSHFRNRLKHIVRGKRLPTQPVDIRSAQNRQEDEIAFVNHNPKTVIKQLAHAGLTVEHVLSVSNLRSTLLKKAFSQGTLLALEKMMQEPLAKTYFGPSVFLLVKKVS